MYLHYQKIQNTPTDLAAFYVLRNEPRDLYWSGYTTPHTIESFTAWYQQQLQKTDRTIWLLRSIVDTTQTVGYLYLNTEQEANQTIGVLSVGISEQYKGQGLAAQAINFLVNHAKQIGIETLQAWIAQENMASAQSFLKNGFQPTTQTKKLYYESFGKELILLQYIFNG